MAKREINLDLLDKVTAATLEDYIINVDSAQELRVERLLLELVRPDPVQPRRVLPDHIYYAFHNNKLTPTQALREVVRSAQVAARQRGRPLLRRQGRKGAFVGCSGFPECRYTRADVPARERGRQ